MNVLLTGANGFLGRELSYRLEKDNFTVFKSTSRNLNLKNFDLLKKFFKKNKIDLVIHAATKGGSRFKEDSLKILHENVVMFNNLFHLRDFYGKMINFSSGADFGRDTLIENKSEKEIINSFPEDFYGASKNIISNFINREKSNIFNLRLFGCFGPLEDDTRFIKKCIKSALSEETFILNENKKMDYFYVGDLYKVILHYLNCLEPSSLDKDVNLCYADKISLLEIIRLVELCSGLDIKVDFSGRVGKDYTGDATKLLGYKLELDGLRSGIMQTYRTLSERY